jgi:Fe-S-cluster containining protein
MGGLAALRALFRTRPAGPRAVERGCLRCGRCCEAFGGHLHASKADLERWTRLGRTDLLRRVGPVSGWIWLDPDSGRLEETCPFLTPIGPDTAICSIQDVKPDICRDYPTVAHGRRCLRGGFLD